MSKKSDVVKNRSRLILERLLAYANYELVDYNNSDLHQKIYFRWSDENSARPKLIIRADSRVIIELIFQNPPDSKLKDRFIYALEFLEKLNIFEDNREQTCGVAVRHFTLKLWDKSTQINLRKFEEHCKSYKEGNFNANEFQEIANSTYLPRYQDWGDAPAVDIFFGRQAELATLKKWIISDCCRVVAIVGMKGIGKTDLSIKLGRGGIGKTDLSLQLAKEVAIKDEFEYIIWRKLLNAPPVTDILADLIQFISNQEEIDLPKSIDKQISLLINSYLNEHRCLLILDNIETVLKSPNSLEKNQETHNEYLQLFEAIGERKHQSCLLLTSREIPTNLERLEGAEKAVRFYRLEGLNSLEGKQIFQAINPNFSASEQEWKQLVDFYSGNPLALELAARHIQDAHFGNITKFLHEGRIVFQNINQLLDWHFEQLSEQEKEITYWLAINRQPLSYSQLKDDLAIASSQDKLSQKNLSSVLQLLQRKLPLEKNQERETFTLQPVLIEYVTEQLISQICEEIKTGNINLLNSHALLKAQAQDYIRESQSRVILKPIKERLVDHYNGKVDLEAQFKQIILILQEKFPQKDGYAGGNIINLLCQLTTTIKDYDFSNLTIWQAYLQGIKLHRVNFAYSDLSKSVFTNVFGNVLSVSCNHDASLIAMGDVNGNIYLWQTENRQKILSLTEHSSWVMSVAFSPDGTILASGSDDQTVRLWDVESGQCIKTFSGANGHNSWVMSVAFSPDGTILASGSEDGTIKLWNVKSRKYLNTLSGENGHKDRVWQVAFSPDGKTLASSSDDGTIKLWKVESRKYLKTLTGHEGWVLSVAFSPDGKTLASSGSSHVDKTVRLWNVESGTEIASLVGHKGWVLSVAFSPDGKILVGAGEDTTIRLWDLEYKTLIKTLTEHESRIWSVVFSSNGKTLVSGSDDRTVRLWNVESRKCIKTLQGYTNWILSVAFSPNGKILASSSEDKTIKLWKVESGQCINILEEHTNKVWSVTFSPDGKILASGSDDQTVKLWKVESGQCLATLQGHQSLVLSVAFSPDGKILASGSEDKTIKLWKVESGAEIASLSEHNKRIRTVVFSPDGKTLASGSDDGTIKLWEVEFKKSPKTISVNLRAILENSSRVWSIAFSPDSQTLASCSSDQTIRLWKVESDEIPEPQTLTGHNKRIRAVAFSPDGETLASCSDDGTIKLWKFESGAEIASLSEQMNRVPCVTFSPDGKTLASGNDDETIKLWNVDSKRFNTLKLPRLYEETIITGVTGLTQSQKIAFKDLGAIDN